MLKVLQVVSRLTAGGEQTFIMSVYRNIDINKVHFDFVVFSDEGQVFETEVKSKGSIIYRCPRYNGKNHIQYCKWWNDFFKTHKEYDIVHGHVRSTAAIYLNYAKKNGCCTISHSHSISNGRGFSAFVKGCMQKKIPKVSDYMLACSFRAGKWLFGKKYVNSNKFEVIYNGIDCDRFSYNEKKRYEMRQLLNINDKYVIGQVGRFQQMKNHFFTVDLLEMILKIIPNSVLLLVGDGDLKDSIYKYAQNKNIDRNIIFTGKVMNTEDYYQAMDVFVMPSIFEGLGIVSIEAQCSGLVALCSDMVPIEAKVTNHCFFLPLDNKHEWCKKIYEAKEEIRIDCSEIIKTNGYDIIQISHHLIEIYNKLYLSKMKV